MPAMENAFSCRAVSVSEVKQIHLLIVERCLALCGFYIFDTYYYKIIYNSFLFLKICCLFSVNFS